MVKDTHKVNFSYRDNLWHGTDLLATGVASFGHVSGVHYQNQTEWGDYIGDLLEHGQLPLYRGTAADAAPAARPRDDPAAQDGLARRGLLPPQVRRRNPRRMARRVARHIRAKAC